MVKTKVSQSIYIAVHGTVRISADWNNFKTVREAKKYFKDVLSAHVPKDVEYTINKVTLRTVSYQVR